MAALKNSPEVLEARRQLAAKIRTDWEFKWPSHEAEDNDRARHDSLDAARSFDFEATSATVYADDARQTLRPRFYASSEPSSNSSLSSMASQNIDEKSRGQRRRKPSFSAPLVAARSTGGSAREYFDVTTEPVDQEQRGRKRERQRRRRIGREQAEVQWNDGLRCWVERRDKWCCARKAAPRQTMKTARDSTSTDIINEKASSDNHPTPALSSSAMFTAPQVLIPLAPPLLPPSDPTYAHITPAHYPSIYSKVVLHSLTPSVPINLSHFIPAMVEGWKADGEWPPRSGLPEVNTAPVASNLALSSISGAGAPRKGKSSTKRAGGGLTCMPMPSFGALAVPVATTAVAIVEPPVVKASKRMSLTCMPMPSFPGFTSAGGGSTSALEGPSGISTSSAPTSPLLTAPRTSSRSGLLGRRLLDRRAQQTQTSPTQASTPVVQSQYTPPLSRSHSFSQSLLNSPGLLSRSQTNPTPAGQSTTTKGPNTIKPRRSTASSSSALGQKVTNQSSGPSLGRRSTQPLSQPPSLSPLPPQPKPVGQSPTTAQPGQMHSHISSRTTSHSLLPTQLEEPKSKQEQEKEMKALTRKPVPISALTMDSALPSSYSPSAAPLFQNFNAGDAILLESEKRTHSRTLALAALNSNPTTPSSVNMGGLPVWNGTSTSAGAAATTQRTPTSPTTQRTISTTTSPTTLMIPTTTKKEGSISAGSQSSGRERLKKGLRALRLVS